MDSKLIREIFDRSIEALDPIIREYPISGNDLHEVARFLNRVGATGLFPSLLDIAFAMTIIDRDRAAGSGVRPSLEGPEYVAGAPYRADGNLLEKEVPADVPRLKLFGRILDAATSEPLPGAELDLWNTDQHGDYDEEGYHLRGVVKADDQGRYECLTILPRDYSTHDEDAIGELLDVIGRSTYRPAHVHLKVRVDGVERLTSQLYISDSPYLDSDYVVGAVSNDLLITPERCGDQDENLFCVEYDFTVSVDDNGEGR